MHGVVARGLFASLCFISAAVASPNDVGDRLELHRERSSPFDLEVTGDLANVPRGESRFLRWEQLRRLPTRELRITGEFVAGEQNVTVLLLSDLWSRLEKEAGSDVILAECQDGYAAVYQEEFIRRHSPFVVLEIEGRPPTAWPPKGMEFDPGPYVISVSTQLAPELAGHSDLDHKRPWGVTRLKIARYGETFKAFYSGAWAQLTEPALRGREIWIRSCTSCHTGPDSTFGGTKSQRPFGVVAAHAHYNRDYFIRYVRDPKSANPGAAMQAHPHYTDEEMTALLAFITTGMPR